MARVTIQDLPQSADLDRAAMAAIQGGVRSGVRRTDRVPAGACCTRIVTCSIATYPPNVGPAKPAIVPRAKA